MSILVALLLAAPGPHVVQAEAHRDASPVLERSSFARGRQVDEPLSFSRVVYGYYPYWAGDTDSIPWRHLTHLSYFSVEVNADGTLGSSHGWESNGAALVATGHASGVAVTLTATLFDQDEIGALLADPARRTRLVDNLLGLVQGQGGDGVNIDFEVVPRSAKQDFVDFMAEITTAFHDAIPGSHVSLASVAVDWHGSYDYDQLALACDGLMIMGYGYHWSNGDPGPVAPIYSGSTWSGPDLVWTIEDYFTWGGEENRGQFVLGLPLYGRNWPATDGAIPGTATGRGEARILELCDSDFAAGKTWDEDSQTPFRVYQDGGEWRQLFCEDEASLAAKLDLINEYDLGGVMFWAVGYAPTDHVLWDLVDERFTEANIPPVAAALGPDRARVGETVALDGTASHDADGDPLTYQWTATVGPPVELTGSEQPIVSVVLTEVGQYTFELMVSDGRAEATAEVVLVALEPPIDAHFAAEGCGCGAGRAFWLVPVLVFLRRARRQQKDGD
jgi:spore germination protein YaaH